MFEDDDTPRVFGVAPGADFPKVLVDGIFKRIDPTTPEAIAHVEIIVNTRRMQRRVKTLFDEGSATLLPRIRLVTEFANNMQFGSVPPAMPALPRRLEAAQLVRGLLEAQPNIAPQSALFDLTDSLLALMDEMASEGVPVSALEALDISDVSGHWQRSLEFVRLIAPVFSEDAPSAEARLRLVILQMVAFWQKSPPKHPVILAGSTGSRAPTAELMRAVAHLPNGAVVLPGFDFDMPDVAWKRLDTALEAEGHSQYRFSKFLAHLETDFKSVAPWSHSADSTLERRRLVSLAMRPAPVTDQWMIEGPKLTGIDRAAEDLTLIEARSERAEASAIAVLLRSALEQGETAALISPDRNLARRVAAILDRWRIVPDDSAGRPLSLSAPGRLLRQVAAEMGDKITNDRLFALLKHPLVASTEGLRGDHLLYTRELELWVRKKGPSFISVSALARWKRPELDGIDNWIAWLSDILTKFETASAHDLTGWLDAHLTLTQALSAGPNAEGTGELWLEAAGVEALRMVEDLQRHAASGGPLSHQDYTNLIARLLHGVDVRESIQTHPDVMIWGTLEARVQGADLVVLGGLNEGAWPSPPQPDPWLNRALRAEVGLLLPERQIGLAAHDFQQAVCAPKVALTRATRDAEAQTVPSRWLNRLTNLLGGIGEAGTSALERMRDQGNRWISISEALDVPEKRLAPAKRPAPRPPAAARRNDISITEVEKLIRDPYAVYSRRILGLDRLKPLRRQPDAAERGTTIHKVAEHFIRKVNSGELEPNLKDFLAEVTRVLEERVEWPTARKLWFTHLEKLADWFIDTELRRQNRGAPVALEGKCSLNLGQPDVSLIGKIDRIDADHLRQFSIFDYKTGAVPKPDVQKYFDKQLLLSALLVSNGGVKNLAAGTVAEVGYIGLGSKPHFDPRPVTSDEISQTFVELRQLLASYLDPAQGYTSRRAMDQLNRPGDFDHLARFGEWDASSDPVPEDVG